MTEIYDQLTKKKINSTIKKFQKKKKLFLEFYNRKKKKIILSGI